MPSLWLKGGFYFDQPVDSTRLEKDVIGLMAPPSCVDRSALCQYVLCSSLFAGFVVSGSYDL